LKPLLTDSRELPAGQHIDDPASADSRPHDHFSGMIGNHFSDNAGIFAVIILLDSGKYFLCASGIDNGDEFSFIGNIKGIKS
jgi:hypothetical protein